MSNEKEGVDLLVKEYLISRGYTKAAAELDLEAPKLPNDSGTLPSSNTSQICKSLLSNVAEDLYVLGMKDRDPMCYFHAYDSLRTWTLDAMDLAKQQLLSLCFPVFVHR
jgi:hypothetical protein